MILPISDWNLSSSIEEKRPTKLFYVSKNGNTYTDKELWCYHDEKKQLYYCDADITDSGWLEFDMKRERINIEELCTDDCRVHFEIPSSLDILIVTDTTTEYIEKTISYPLGGGGELNTMYNPKKRNDEYKKVWVKGYKCDFKKPKVIFYTIHEYINAFPKVEEQDKLFPYFNQKLEGSDVLTLPLSQSYRNITSMMYEEGFSSNWINEKDIELFIYSNNRALIKIKSSVKSLNKQSCLSGGYYFLELDNDRIKIKRGY